MRIHGRTTRTLLSAPVWQHGAIVTDEVCCFGACGGQPVTIGRQRSSGDNAPTRTSDQCTSSQRTSDQRTTDQGRTDRCATDLGHDRRDGSGDYWHRRPPGGMRAYRMYGHILLRSCQKSGRLRSSCSLAAWPSAPSSESSTISLTAPAPTTCSTGVGSPARSAGPPTSCASACYGWCSPLHSLRSSSWPSACSARTPSATSSATSPSCSRTRFSPVRCSYSASPLHRPPAPSSARR